MAAITEPDNNLRLLSRNVADVVRQTSQNEAYLPPPEQGEQIRSQYLTIVANKGDVDNDIIVALLIIAKEVAKTILNCDETKAGTMEEPMELAFRLKKLGAMGNEFTEGTINVENFFIVGRFPSSDIHTGLFDIAVSRISFIGFRLPGNKIAIVDFWSLMGVNITKHEGIRDSDCLSSLPNNRRVMIIDPEKAVNFFIGYNTELTLNPRMCVVCWELTRSVVFNGQGGCNHFAVCNNCASKLTKCPLCRATIVSAIQPTTSRITTLQTNDDEDL